VVAAKHATYVPHTAGRYSVKRFRKAQCPIVERLTNSLMMHGRNNGKKLMAVRIIKHAMEIIHLLTDLNPIQVIVDAVVNRYTNEKLPIFIGPLTMIISWLHDVLLSLFNTFVTTAGQGKMLHVLALQGWLGVKLWIFLHCGV
jgi:hypothetical protein